MLPPSPLRVVCLSWSMGLGCENPGGCDKVIVRCSADSIAEYAWCLWWKLLIYTQTFTYIYHHWCMIRSQGWDLPDLMDFSFIEGFFFGFEDVPKNDLSGFRGSTRMSCWSWPKREASALSPWQIPRKPPICWPPLHPPTSWERVPDFQSL